MRLAAAITALTALAACGPITPERAAELCEDRARAATGPTGTIGVGVGSDGAEGFISIGVSGDYLQGRDPQEVYETCVERKTGQGPIRPLNLE